MSEPEQQGQPPRAVHAQSTGGFSTLPPTLPESWLNQIAEVQSQALPREIPESWLCRIKEAAKPNLLTTFLGSSLIAALIGMGSSALTAYLSDRSAEKLERVKIQLQAQGEQLKNRIQAYNKLAHNLNSLASDLDAYLRMIDIAAKSSHATFSPADLDTQRKKVGQSEKEVLAVQQEVGQFDSVLSSEIDSCLQNLNPALAKQAQEAGPSLRDTLTQLKQLVSRVNHELNTAIAKSTFG